MATYLLLLVAAAVVCAQSGLSNPNTEYHIVNRGHGNVTNLTASYFQNLGAKRVKLSYGPFVVPGTKEKDGGGEKEFYQPEATTPCNNCTITWMQMGLEHIDGTKADFNSSVVYQHATIMNTDKEDTICQGPSLAGERFFLSGNERTPVDLTQGGKLKTGYYLGENALLLLNPGFLNLAEHNQTVRMTTTYEYVPGLPSDFSTVTPVWLDIASCNSSGVVPPNLLPASYTQLQPWTAPFGGRIAKILGHFHDGGVQLDVNQRPAGADKASVACHPVAKYGGDGLEDPPSVPPIPVPTSLLPVGPVPTTASSQHINSVKAAASQSSARSNISGVSMRRPRSSTNSSLDSPPRHIGSISTCDTGRVAVGDVWSVNALYNYTLHPPIVNVNGTVAPIMGIGLLYIAVDANETSENNLNVGGEQQTQVPSMTSVLASKTGAAPASSSTAKNGVGRTDVSAWKIWSAMGIVVLLALIVP